MKPVVIALLPFIILAGALCAVPRASAGQAGLVRIAGGTFMMGSPEGEAGRGKDETRHRVRLSPFYLGRYEVTQKEYRDLTGEGAFRFTGDSLPVENVTWLEAVRYCNLRSRQEGLEPAYAVGADGRSVTWNRRANGYRLPTEAEWEYACRAGTETPFHTGENISVEQANYYGHYPYNDAPRQRYRETTVPVGGFPPNAWGLHDMHGNVWEWCWDWYGEYGDGEQVDPDGPEEGVYRVNRGGGWNDFGRHVRSAYRAAHTPVNKTFNLGFRLARNAE